MDTFLSFAPAIVTVFIAILTHKTLLALLIGLISGIFIFSGFNFYLFSQNIYNYSEYIFTDINRIKIAIFVLLIGSFLKILNESGAFYSFAQYSLKYINTPRKSRLAAFFMSLFLFFDDYANVLITGTTFRTICDKNKVTAYKLAYIIDTVSCVCSIALISTWAYYEISIINESLKIYTNIASPLVFFIKSIPFNFYTIIAVSICFAYCYTGYWFSTNRMTAHTKKDLNTSTNKARPYIMIVPLFTLILTTLLLVLILGIRESESLTLIGILGAAPSLNILIISTLLSIIVLITLCLKDKVFTNDNALPILVFKGAYDMLSVAFIILIANGLSRIFFDLKTGTFLAEVFYKFSIQSQFLPMFVFLVTVITSVFTGSSWSTMAIIMPIAYQLIFINGLDSYVYIVTGAVISGSLCGVKLVPYSDKVVLSSVSTQVSTFLHIKTQFPYVLISIFITLCSYINYIIFQNIFYVFIQILIFIILFFKILSFHQNKKK